MAPKNTVIKKEIVKFIRYRIGNKLSRTEAYILVENIWNLYEAYVKDYGTDPSRISDFFLEISNDKRAETDAYLILTELTRTNESDLRLILSELIKEDK